MNRTSLIVAVLAVGCFGAIDGLPRLISYFYDPFNDLTFMAYAGGYVIVDCIGSDNAACDGGSTLELLDPSGTIIRSRKCNATGTEAVWRINIDQNVTLGGYKCRQTTASGFEYATEALNLLYRACSPDEQWCRDVACTDSSMSCVHSVRRGVNSCGSMPDAKCFEHAPSLNTTRVTVCPVRASSLCKAIALNYSRALFGMGRLLNGSFPSCPSEHAVPRVLYPMKYRLYYEPILLDPSTKVIRLIYSHNPDFDGANLSCIIKTKDGEIVDQHVAKSGHAVNLSLKETLFHSGSKVYKMNCTYFGVQNRPLLIGAQTSNYLVVLGGTPKITHSAGTSEKVTLHCGLQPPPDPDFEVSYHWNVKNRTNEIHKQNITVPQWGEYQCHVNIQFRWCAPRRHFEVEVSSEWTPAVVAVTTAVTQKASTTTPRTGPTSSAQKSTVSCLWQELFMDLFIFMWMASRP